MKRNSKLLGPTSGTAVTLKTGKREVPGSNSGGACRPSRSEFSVVSPKLVKYGLGSLRKTPTEDTPPIGLGPSETIGLNINIHPSIKIIREIARIVNRIQEKNFT